VWVELNEPIILKWLVVGCVHFQNRKIAMPNFEPVNMVLTTADGQLVVPDVPVRLRTRDRFYLNRGPGGTPPSSSNNQPLPQLPPQPFRMDLSTPDWTNRYQESTLRFDQSALADPARPADGWHVGAFDPWCQIYQWIDFESGDQKLLTINLSCTVHHLVFADHLAAKIEVIGEHVASAASAIVLKAKRSFGVRAPLARPLADDLERMVDGVVPGSHHSVVCDICQRKNGLPGVSRATLSALGRSGYRERTPVSGAPE
jgi:hypothetical protein